MAQYVDGFILPVKKARLDEYRRMARKYDKLWIAEGALAVHECVADDVKPGKLTSFPQAVMLQDDEVVVFSWIVYRSRKHRDKVNAAVMARPEMQGMSDKDMPMDGKRMFWGGFKEIVALTG
jgi:uncharacterized protein YbaA (DUF1428 family)